jgi:hypothetical protein
MELQEFYEHMERHRAAVVESAIQRYRSLTPLLGKVRGKVMQAVSYNLRQFTYHIKDRKLLAETLASAPFMTQCLLQCTCG